MNKRFLLAAALCAAMNLSAFAQTNLAKDITPTKIGTTVTGTNIPETLVGLTDGKMDNIYLMPEPSAEGSAIQAFSIDLGASYELGQIKIYWEGAATKDVKISVSDNNTTWKEAVYKTDLGQRTEDSFTLAADTKGRYVKFEATVAVNWGWGVKMREFEVYKAETATLNQISTSVGFVTKDEATELNLKATDQFGSDFTGDVTYTADNGTITDGKLTATKGGACTITATANGKTATTTVYVLDDTMAPTKPTAKADNVYSIYGSNYTSNKFVQWMTWTGTDLNMAELTLGGQKVKPFAGGSKIVIGQKATEDAAGEQWMQYENSESKYTNLSMDVFATEDFDGNLAVEANKQEKDDTAEGGYKTVADNKTVKVSLKAGQWNTIELAGVPESTIKCVSIEKQDDTLAPILISNIYLYKLNANQVVVSKTTDAKGFYNVTGNISAENVAELKNAEGIAFDLTAAKIADDVKKIEFANPNAIVMVAGSNTDFSTANKLTETNNVITTDGNYYYAAKTLKFNDAQPICTSISIDISKGATTGYEYTRGLTAGSWSTTTPITTTNVPEGVEAYELDTENSADNKIVFKKAEALIGGTPYVLHANAAATLKVEATTGDFNPTLDPSTATATNVTFHGNYQAKKGTQTEYALQNATIGDDNNLTFKKVGEGATIGTFRAYLTVNEGNDETVAYSISFGGQTTGIGNIHVVKGNQKTNGVYTLYGRKVSEGTSLNSLPKGIYIVNSKKIVK